MVNKINGAKLAVIKFATECWKIQGDYTKKRKSPPAIGRERGEPFSN